MLLLVISHTRKTNSLQHFNLTVTALCAATISLVYILHFRVATYPAMLCEHNHLSLTISGGELLTLWNCVSSATTICVNPLWQIPHLPVLRGSVLFLRVIGLSFSVLSRQDGWLNLGRHVALTCLIRTNKSTRLDKGHHRRQPLHGPLRNSHIKSNRLTENKLLYLVW